jgi:hypothetical protein
VCPSGCGAINGADNAFSSRVMWRDDGNGRGKLLSYMYIPERLNTCGDDWDWTNAIAADAWMQQKTYIRLNDPGMP